MYFVVYFANIVYILKNNVAFGLCAGSSLKTFMEPSFACIGALNVSETS
jgi:hypothetical protein